jgi:hypothetical protein
VITSVRTLLLTLIPTLALIAADSAPGLAVWDAGAGTLGSEPSVRGVGVRPGIQLSVAPDGPARIILPGTANGYLTLAAGSSVTLTERRIDGKETSTAELLVTISAGAVAVGGDIAPRFVAVRVRGLVSETVAAPGVGLVVESDQKLGDTVVALDGPVGIGPLPAKANGWQAIAERVTLDARTMVVIDPQRGVGEPIPAPGRPQLVGHADSRPSLSTLVKTAPASGDLTSSDLWTLDVAARHLGPADPIWWTAPPAPPEAAAAAKSWSALVQVSSFYDSNPNGVASDLGGGNSDGALSVFGDVRWACWNDGSYSVLLQAIGGGLGYRGVKSTDDLNVQHDSQDKNQYQAAINAALVRNGEQLDWSVGVAGQITDDAKQDRRLVRLSGDVGAQLSEDAYAVLNLGWASNRIDPSTASSANNATGAYTAQVATARSALVLSWSGNGWSSNLETSLLYTDSHSDVAADDFYALRPGVSYLHRLGRLDLGLAVRGEFITYRAARAMSETMLAEETVVQTTLTADWWATATWSAGLFGNHIWFDSNQQLADYTQTQVGVRSTIHW